jgi:KDO2-lipid IV(A) lauroyltransferase
MQGGDREVAALVLGGRPAFAGTLRYACMTTDLALRLCYATSRIVCVVAFGLFGLRRSVITENLARSFPERTPAARRALRREFLRRQAELAAEVVHAVRIDEAELRQRVTLANPEVLAAAAPPRPMILAGSHLGNFEWAQLRVSLELGERLLALYKPMHNARAERWFRRMRTRFGARLVAAKSVIAQLAQFRDAAAIGIIADQVPSTNPDRYWTGFLGQDTAFYMGPELLGRALRSQVLFADMRRIARGRYELRFILLNELGERLPTGTVTERYARELERAIRNDPPGWWWSHRRWKLTREPLPERAAPAE